jgi:hypothetical protein
MKELTTVLIWRMGSGGAKINLLLEVLNRQGGVKHGDVDSGKGGRAAGNQRTDIQPGVGADGHGGPNAALTPGQSIAGMRKVLEDNPMELTGNS